jgi:hypothetical protein
MVVFQELLSYVKNNITTVRSIIRTNENLREIILDNKNTARK